MDYLWSFLCIVLLFSSSTNCGVNGNVHGSTIQTLKFTMAELRALNTGQFVNSRPSDFDSFPDEVKRKKCRKGGVRRRNSKRGTRPILPSVITGNVQSISNKMDELYASLRFRDFRNCSMMCFSETWLHDKIHDPVLNGFTLLRADRDKEITKKSKGGGVCVYVNKEWCHPANITVKQKVCTPHVELLCVAARPYYLPREFSHVIVTVVYIPPQANEKEATDTLFRLVSDQQTASPDALFLVTGDFNRTSLKNKLPTFQQCVNVHTWKDKTIDLFYTNV